MMWGFKTQASVVAAVMATALPAAAGDFGFAFNFSKGRHRGFGVDVGVVVGRPAVVAPVPVVGPPVVVAPAPVAAVPVVPVVPVRPVLVPPVYHVVAERVWVPTVQTLYRDVPVYDVCGRVVSYRREAYTVPSGYWTVVQRRVIAREGYWTTAVDTVAAPPIHADPAQPDFDGIEPGEDYGNVGYDRRPEPPRQGYRPAPGTMRASAIQDRPPTY